MIITHNENGKSVQHPSGFVDFISMETIESEKAEAQQVITEKQADIVRLDSDISIIESLRS